MSYIYYDNAPTTSWEQIHPIFIYLEKSFFFPPSSLKNTFTDYRRQCWELFFQNFKGAILFSLGVHYIQEFNHNFEIFCSVLITFMKELIFRNPYYDIPEGFFVI